MISRSINTMSIKIPMVFFIRRNRFPLIKKQTKTTMKSNSLEWLYSQKQTITSTGEKVGKLDSSYIVGGNVTLLLVLEIQTR